MTTRSPRPGGDLGVGMKRPNITDRFIPNRGAMDLEIAFMELMNQEYDDKSCERSSSSENASSLDPEISRFTKEEYKRELVANLFEGSSIQNRVLAFRDRSRPYSGGYQSDLSLRSLYSHNKIIESVPRKFSRHISQSPERILDLPDFLDDYYLNLLDWSSTNILAVALGDEVYLWNAGTGSIQKLMKAESEGGHVTSISWNAEGNCCAVGTSDHDVQLWDTEKSKRLRTLRGHRGRVGSLAWNGAILSSGSRSSSIHHHDVRAPQHVVGKLNGHSQEVCGLRWSPNGLQLASGGNDNLLNIWDDRSTRACTDRKCSQTTSLFQFRQHKAAVKALAWCPWQKHLLASGGGTLDRMIRFWNTQTGTCLDAVDAQSQVCALQWSRHDKELVSSHGFCHNQLVLWKYPSMVKVVQLTGHTARVLHLASSPDGMTVASAAADETLRFWKVFSGGEGKGSKASLLQKESILHSMSIR